MSNLINPILVSGYEDYEPFVVVTKAGQYPDMWPEEHYADGQLWEEQKRQRELAIKRGFTRVSPEQQKLERVLAGLAEENGWIVMNPVEVEYGLENPRYVIAPNDEPFYPMPKPKPNGNGMELDNVLLAEIMSDLIPSLALHLKEKRPRMTLPPGADLQSFVVYMLAKEKGWQLTEPESRGKQVYRT